MTRQFLEDLVSFVPLQTSLRAYFRDTKDRKLVLAANEPVVGVALYRMMDINDRSGPPDLTEACLVTIATEADGTFGALDDPRQADNFLGFFDDVVQALGALEELLRAEEDSGA